MGQGEFKYVYWSGLAPGPGKMTEDEWEDDRIHHKMLFKENVSKLLHSLEIVTEKCKGE